ncbi:MAG TPA: beta-L-arabinofuranosidase domain-containing protein [Abditibacteriaceae bacterium]
MSKPCAVIVDTAQSSHVQLHPVPVEAVRLEDKFWEPRRKINREKTLPSQYKHLEETGRLNNFRRAAGTFDGPFEGIYFNDSDVYKWLEAAAWELACGPNEELQAMVDECIELIAEAQQADGYLNTYFMFDLAPERWSNLKDKHELYCAGHLIQAAIAHYRATGSEKLLVVARRLANCICATFGPKTQNKREETDGHEEIEMALVELYRATREERYLKQAQFFLEVRGRGTIGGSEYHQDHEPLRDQKRMTGHAVRHVYLCAGGADLVAESGDEAILAALHRLWQNMVYRQMYVTGGIGSRYEGEAFGRDFELPNERAYTETCAAIGSVMWNWRMLQLEADARFADLMELALYNGVMAGISLDGENYFYQNPLADDGTHRRQPWFGCACCPPNIARLLSQLPGYFYSVSDEGIWAHFYGQSTAHIALPGGGSVVLKQHTKYPFEGEIEIEISALEDVPAEREWTLFLRAPLWCSSFHKPKINGKSADVSKPKSGGANYLSLHRAWAKGDRVSLSFPMPVQRLEAHPYAAENQGRVALMRGPLVYCLEGADHRGHDLRDFVLPNRARIETDERPFLLGGITVLTAPLEHCPLNDDYHEMLYFTHQVRPRKCATQSAEMTAIPYYAWANRAPGQMQVWIRTR